MAKITTYYKGDMLFESQLGDHKLVIDMPQEMGGHNRGPHPTELFIASIGACAAVRVASYCQDEGIDSRDMSVDVTCDKIGKPIRLVNLKVTINLPHGKCQDREGAIRRVAKHCPVSETLSTLETIEFVLVDQETAFNSGEVAPSA